MQESAKNEYSEAIALGNYFMVEKLMELEQKKKRKEKKKNVYNEKGKLILETYEGDKNNIIDKTNRQNLLCNLVKEDQRATYLIDLAFTSPFAPYELKFKKEDFKKALLYMSSLLSQDFDIVDDILKNQQEALKSHKKIEWAKIIAFGVGGLLIFAWGGWLMAPAIGTAIGTAAGLSGAAATSHGLAILGGGALSISGWGMAGGMWVVTGAGGFIGASILGGSPLLLQLGAAQARVEILKLQVTYKTVFVVNQAHHYMIEKSIDKLVNMKKEIMKELVKEENLNDKSSKRIKDIKETLDTLNNAIDWMRKNKIPA